MSVKNKEAVAALLAINVAVHDAIHNGVLSPYQVSVLLSRIAQDMESLLHGNTVKVGFHDDWFLSLQDDCPEAQAAQGMLDEFLERVLSVPKDINPPSPRKLH